ncbi:MAG: ATP-binding cassette domain-containing protein [Phycisphaerales bacterium]
MRVEIGGQPVLRGVNVDAAPGSVVAIVGASGSGKTMTGLAVLGLLPPGAQRTGGTIEVGGEPVRGAADAARLRGRRVGMIFQEPRRALHPLRTIGSQLREVVSTLRGERGAAARATIKTLLDDAGFPDAMDRLDARPHQLSGGEAQRIGIALALAGDPAVLLADEPTTALDVLVQRTILERLHHLARSRRMAVILVSHDLRVVAEVADRAFVMDAGQTVESAPVTAIFDAPQAAATRQLLAASGLAAGREPAAPSA